MLPYRIFLSAIRQCVLLSKPIWDLFPAKHYDLHFSKASVSTWLDCSRWMSKPRKISPFVLGNKSTAFLTSKLPFSRPRTFSETGRCACPYLYNTAAHIFQSPRHFALREYVRKSVVYHPLDSTAGSCTDTNPCLGIHTGKEAHILLFADSHASQKSYDSSWPRMEYQKQR